MAIKITCIKKANGDHENPYVAIESMNWTKDGSIENITSTREQMYDFVNGGGYAYVEDKAGNKAKLVARLFNDKTKYVKTVADDVKSDNLLKLQECKN